MGQFDLPLRALILAGVIAFAFFLAFQYGLVTRVVEADRSYLSLVILILYGVLSVHWLWLTWRVGEEIRLAGAWRDGASAAGQDYLTGALRRDLERCTQQQQIEQLLALYQDQLMNRHALGHFATEVLLRLGLLGTIFGFILMLLPVSEIQAFEPALMQQLLASMSGGMAVALYTTMAGLVTSTLLRYQYHILDTAAVNLANAVAVTVHTAGTEQGS